MIGRFWKKKRIYPYEEWLYVKIMSPIDMDNPYRYDGVGKILEIGKDAVVCMNELFVNKGLEVCKSIKKGSYIIFNIADYMGTKNHDVFDKTMIIHWSSMKATIEKSYEFNHDLRG